MTVSRRPRARARAHIQGTSRGSRKMTSVAWEKGGRAWRMTISTAVDPSQRTVVRSPSSGRPPCIQVMILRPWRTFQMVPATNQARIGIAMAVISAVTRAASSPGSGPPRSASSCPAPDCPAKV